jgi:[ribosomal protein S18]-alanine N-acetyltransferase
MLRLTKGAIGMTYIFQPMSDDEARIVATWHYEGEYGFYDMDRDPDDLAELLDGAARADRYWAVYDQAGNLAGFFCFVPEGGTVEFGLGLRPDLTGRGAGAAFLEAGLAFARERYKPDRFALAVAAFNQRAIRLYRKAGFRTEREYLQRTNGDEYPFLRMSRGRAPGCTRKDEGGYQVLAMQRVTVLESSGNGFGFQAYCDRSGATIAVGAHGPDGAPAPKAMELIAVGLGLCMGGMLGEILEKKRIVYRNMRMEVQCERGEDGMAFTAMAVRISLESDDLDQATLDKALELASKHCPAHATLGHGVPITAQAEIAK